MMEAVDDFLEAFKAAREVSEEKAHVVFVISYNRGLMAERYSSATADRIDGAFSGRCQELVTEEQEAWNRVAQAAGPMLEALTEYLRKQHLHMMQSWGGLMKAKLSEDEKERSQAKACVAVATTEAAACFSRMYDLLEAMKTDPSHKREATPTLAESVRCRHVSFVREWAEGFEAELQQLAAESRRLVELNRRAVNATMRVRKVFLGR